MVLAIKGHPTRGKEVIEILEMLGGKVYIKEIYKGEYPDRYYYINKNDGFIDTYFSETVDILNAFQTFTLEEFLEKFPYKVGDRVRVCEYESEVCISRMYWDGYEVQYEVVIDEAEWYSARELNEFNEPNKEETAEDIIKIDIPKGYEFANVDNQQIVFKKIEYQYPKNFKECCEVLGCKANHFFTNFSYDGCDIEISDCEDKIDDLLQNFRKLLYCRNAYWKIAGEQMGLGESWEPDWNDENEFKYGLYHFRNGIMRDGSCINSTLLAFPTEEMRDAFYENFKDLIIECKELL